MRVLLDTNILIHREASVAIKENIGVLFRWLDRLGYEKCIHVLSANEIQNHVDEQVRRTFRAKLASYSVLSAPTSMSVKVQHLSAALDKNDNDRIDTKLLDEVFADRIDCLISEDKGIHRKAKELGIGHKVFTIDQFLEKVNAENPSLADYEVLSVRKVTFHDIDVSDEFFDSFRDDYPEFDRWFGRKGNEPCYVCREAESIVAFLYLKVEGQREPYPDITPTFPARRRLKIGTFKVILNGYKIGERFLKIIFDNAILQKVDEIYVTMFDRSLDQQRLGGLLFDFGFKNYGEKTNSFGHEHVLVRDMAPSFSASDPKHSFPYVSRKVPAYLVPIYPDYHTELFPDSILNTESPGDYVEHEPHRNAISKVYISRSHNRMLRSGELIVFYRTGGYRKGLVSTLGVIEAIRSHIPNEEQFIRLCRKRSVFSDDELRKEWNRYPTYRPFIVEFLYCYSFPKRPNLAALIANHVIANTESVPRGFERLSATQLSSILSLSETNPRIVVD